MLVFVLLLFAAASFVIGSVMIKPPATRVTRQPGFTEGYARGYEDGQSNATTENPDAQPFIT